MEKVDSYSMGKAWENTDISNLWVWVKQKSRQFPKHGKSEFSQYGKGMKKKHSKVTGFSNISCGAKIHMFHSMSITVHCCSASRE